MRIILIFLLIVSSPVMALQYSVTLGIPGDPVSEVNFRSSLENTKTTLQQLANQAQSDIRTAQQTAQNPSLTEQQQLTNQSLLSQAQAELQQLDAQIDAIDTEIMFSAQRSGMYASQGGVSNELTQIHSSALSLLNSKLSNQVAAASADTTTTQGQLVRDGAQAEVNRIESELSPLVSRANQLSPIDYQFTTNDDIDPLLDAGELDWSVSSRVCNNLTGSASAVLLAACENIANRQGYITQNYRPPQTQLMIQGVVTLNPDGSVSRDGTVISVPSGNSGVTGSDSSATPNSQSTGPLPLN